MRKFFVIAVGLLRFAARFRRTSRYPGAGRHRGTNHWTLQAAKLVRQLLRGK